MDSARGALGEFLRRGGRERFVISVIIEGVGEEDRVGDEEQDCTSLSGSSVDAHCVFAFDFKSHRSLRSFCSSSHSALSDF